MHRVDAMQKTSNKLNSVTLSFLNEDSRMGGEYNFAGKSVQYVKNMYSNIPNFSPILAVGGVGASNPNNRDAVLPTILQNQMSNQQLLLQINFEK